MTRPGSTAPRITALSLALFAALCGAHWPPPPGLAPGAMWADFALVAAALAAATAFARGPRSPGDCAWRDVVVWAATAYIGWAVLSAVVHRGAGLWKALALCELPLTLVMARRVGAEARGRDLVLRGFVLGAAALCVVALVGSALAVARVPSVLYSEQGGDLGLAFRAKGLSITSNFLAEFCLAPLLLLAAGGPLFGGRVRGALLTLIGLTVALTLSRTLLAVGAGLAWLALARAVLRGRVDARRARWVAAAAAVALLLVSFVSVRLDIYRAGSALVVSTAPGLRFRIARAALRSIARSPLFGVGPGLLGPVRLPWPRPDDAPRFVDVHVTWLDLPTVLGLPALLPFLAVVGISLRRAWRRARTSMADPVALGLAVALGATMLDAFTVDVEDFRHVWVLLGLTLARYEV